MSKVPLLDLTSQFAALRDEVFTAFEEICGSGRFAQGPAAAAFEKQFATYCHSKHCISLNTGTSALHLAMRCLDIGPGDEVITPPMTFIATAWGISYVNAKPVFVDIDPARRTLDPRKLEAAITPRTKAILPVHLAGQPADMDSILEIGRRHSIPVVEDAAQSHGAEYRGKRAGELGAMACFSFYPGKNLGAYGEGGALVTNDDHIAVRCRSLRDHGQSQRYYHDEIAYNYRMDTLQGAVLGIKLKHLDAWNAARLRHAQAYNAELAGLPVGLPQEFADSRSVWHCYVVEVENRDGVRDALAALGIETGIHYPIPIHLQKAYADLGYKEGDFPVAEGFARRCLSLPIFPEMTDDQRALVVKAVKQVL